MLVAASVLGGLAALIGCALTAAALRLPRNTSQLTDEIDALLPQTQCAQCGFPGCRPYAEAIAAGNARINQCAPGGQATIDALAVLLGEPSRQLDAAFGVTKNPQVASIDEDACIGCLRCVESCPVDAILGAPQYLHTVIAEYCTGCELCIEPCPVDCISLIAEPGP